MVAYSFQPRFVEPIREGRKTHTLRDGRKRHARIGETVQLYQGMRTRECQKIGEGICDRIVSVRLTFAPRPMVQFWPVCELRPGAYARVSEIDPKRRPADEFARSDGFEDFDDLARFWMHDRTSSLRFGDPEWDGFLIGWRSFRCG